MKRWLKISLGFAVILMALGFVVYQGYFRPVGDELEEQYARMRELGIPTTREEYAEMQKGRTRIEELVRDSKAFQQNPAFMDFRGATVSRSGTGSAKIINPQLARRSIKDLDVEFQALRRLIERSNRGYSYPLDTGGAPILGASRDAFSAFVRRARAHLAFGEFEQAVDWSLLHYRLAEQLARSKSPDSFWEANTLTEGSCRELTELLPYIANNRTLVERMLQETKEPMPSTNLTLALIDFAVSDRERLATRDPLDDLKAAFPNPEKMMQASVKNRVQSSRDYLERQIATLRALLQLPDDLAQIEDAIQNHPDLKKQAFLRGNVQMLKDSRVRWALLRAGLLVLDYRLKHGKLPSSASEINMPMDCLTRQPLKYKPTSDGFIVYSPRADGDQGGIEFPPEESWKPQDIPIRVKVSGGAGK